MEFVGKLDTVINQPGNPYIDDTDALEIWKDFEDEYRIVNGTIQSAYESILKYDGLPKTGSLTPFEEVGLMDLLDEIFPRCVQESKLLEPNAVLMYMNLKNSSGILHTHPKSKAIDADWHQMLHFAYRGGYKKQDVAWKVNQKVEVRLKGKLPRTYVGCPIEFQFLEGRLFYAHLGCYKSRPLETPSAWGFIRNEHRPLMEHLLGDGPYVTWDGSEYDSRLPNSLVKLFHNWLASCLIRSNPEFDPEEIDMMVNYHYQQIVHSYCVMPDGAVLQKHRGNPSGNLLTTWLNIVVNVLMVATCAMRFYEPDPMRFARRVLKRVFVYGDDLAASTGGIPRIISFWKEYPYLLSHLTGMASKTNYYNDIRDVDFLGSNSIHISRIDRKVILPGVSDRTRFISSLLHKLSKNVVKDENELLGRTASLYQLIYPLQFSHRPEELQLYEDFLSYIAKKFPSLKDGVLHKRAGLDGLYDFHQIAHPVPDGFERSNF